MNRQSPINIDISLALPFETNEKLSLYWQKFDGLIEDTGYLIRVYGKGGYAVFKGYKFDFVEFHFHTPSEHRINNQILPMEIHFVHYNKEIDEYVVFAVFVKQGENTHNTLQKIVKHLPYKDTNQAVSIDPCDFLPHDTESLYYEGSLTVPPCLETVSWQVFPTAIEAKNSQIEAFSALRNFNARKLQALNNRMVKKMKTQRVK